MTSPTTVDAAFLPAIITYGALFYIVDIEAMKKGMTGLPRERRRSMTHGLTLGLMTFCGMVILAGAVYYGLGWTKTVFGEASGPIAFLVAAALYVALVANRARFPDLPFDDPKKALVKVPDFYEVARTGLHYLVPVTVLICVPSFSVHTSCSNSMPTSFPFSITNRLGA
jgi:TRAP-type uncharacterized transport system fused permease subunit